MLRHAAGQALAEQGIGIHEIAAHLGHTNIQNALRYAVLSARRLAAVRVR